MSFLRGALPGFFIGVPLFSFLVGTTDSWVHRGDLRNTGFTTFLLLITSIAPPYFWGLLVAGKFGLVAMFIFSLRDRLEDRTSALLLGMSAGLLIGNLFMGIASAGQEVWTDPRIVEEFAKVTGFNPLWMPMSFLGAGFLVGAIVGALSWEPKTAGALGANRLRDPIPFWALACGLVVVGILSYAFYEVLWGSGPYYKRKFDL